MYPIVGNFCDVIRKGKSHRNCSCAVVNITSDVHWLKLLRLLHHFLTLKACVIRPKSCTKGGKVNSKKNEAAPNLSHAIWLFWVEYKTSIFSLFSNLSVELTVTSLIVIFHGNKAGAKQVCSNFSLIPCELLSHYYFQILHILRHCNPQCFFYPHPPPPPPPFKKKKKK